MAIIAEGYTLEEEEKVRADLERFRRIFFSQEPYKTHQDLFNFYGVFKPSEQSGCDEPRSGRFKNTAIGAAFNSLGSNTLFRKNQGHDFLQPLTVHVRKRIDVPAVHIQHGPRIPLSVEEGNHDF